MSEPINENNAPDLTHLGQPTAIYKPGLLQIWLGLPILVIFVSMIALAVPFFVYFKAPKFTFLAVIAWVGLVGVLVYRAIRGGMMLSKYRVLIYPDTLVVEYDPQNMIVCPWVNIQNVHYNLGLSNYQLDRVDFLVTLKDGTSFGFPAVKMDREKIQALYDTVRNETMRLSAAPFKDKINSGEGVCFDWLSLTSEGLNNGDKLVPWSDVKDIKRNISFGFSSKGGWIISRHSGENSMELPDELQNIELVIHLIRDFANLSK